MDNLNFQNNQNTYQVNCPNCGAPILMQVGSVGVFGCPACGNQFSIGQNAAQPAVPIPPPVQSNNGSSLLSKISPQTRYFWGTKLKLSWSLAIWTLFCVVGYFISKPIVFEFKCRSHVRNQIELEYQQRASQIERQYDLNMISHHMSKWKQADIDKQKSEYDSQIKSDKKDLRSELELQYANARPGAAYVSAIDTESRNHTMIAVSLIWLLIGIPLSFMLFLKK